VVCRARVKNSSSHYGIAWSLVLPLHSVIHVNKMVDSALILAV
jgi:hypothetical protein